MKKYIYLTIIVLVFITDSFAQKGKGNEYKYFGIKVFATHNIATPAVANNYVLLNSEYGDLMKINNSVIEYSPGGGMSIIYNFDSKNDKSGFVLGIDIQNIGFTQHFKAEELNLKVTNTYRTTQIGVPIFIKYGGSNIYKNQSYVTFGLQFNYFTTIVNIQRSNWNAQPFIDLMDRERIRTSNIALLLGFNTNIYFINIQYLTNNFINPKYTTSIFEEGTIKPQKEVSFMNNIYIQTGVNIPLTRWLTARNWTAEKVRRFLSPTN